MKPIRIKIENKDKIAEAIAEVQKRSQVRTITAEDVFKAVEKAKIHLYDELPVKMQLGVYINVCPHCDCFAKAYKYEPKATCFTIEKKASGWFLTDVRRGECRETAYTKGMAYHFSEEQKRHIADVLMHEFCYTN